MCVRERFRGPFTVSVGQLRARSGQVSGLRPAWSALGGGGDCASGTGPFGGVFPQVTVLRLVVPGPAESGCVSWRIAACGRLADGIRPGDYRISWASCGPHGVPGDRHRDGTLAVTEGEYRQAAKGLVIFDHP